MRSRGFGFSRRRGYQSSVGWNDIVTNKTLNNSSFNATFLGDKRNGDVKVEWKLFRDVALKRYEFFDLCSFHDDGSKEGILLCVETIREGRDIIVRMNDTIDYDVVSLIHSVSALFSEIYLMRLVSTDKFSGEKYLICKSRNTREFKDLQITDSFVKWITEINDIHIDDELFYRGEIKRAIKEGNKYRHPYSYDLLSILTMWHLPDVNKLIGYDLMYRKI